jgi:putative membrane protein
MIADPWLDGWGVLVWLASAAFWILVIAGIVVLLRSNTGRGSDSALRVLEERYARGEVSREEFLERRSVLTKDPPTAATPPPPDEPPAEPARETKPL